VRAVPLRGQAFPASFCRAGLPQRAWYRHRGRVQRPPSRYALPAEPRRAKYPLICTLVAVRILARNERQIRSIWRTRVTRLAVSDVRWRLMPLAELVVLFARKS
jgi:hypothetical protein